MREIEDLRSVLKGAEWSSSGTPIAAQPSFLFLAVFVFHPLHLRSPHDDIVRREMLRILINTILGELLGKLPKASSIWLFSLIKPTIFSARQHNNCASVLSHALGASIERHIITHDTSRSSRHFEFTCKKLDDFFLIRSLSRYCKPRLLPHYHHLAIACPTIRRQLFVFRSGHVPKPGPPEYPSVQTQTDHLR
jgi:hypothetical protein